jgi:hypothetical protein
MKNDLIARYIYAVIKHLPKKSREDIRAELEGLIDDMLKGRCGDVLPTENDVRVVLAELGAPAELAEKYSPDKENTLIGPPYYGLYKLLLKIILPCLWFGLTLSAIIGGLMGEQQVWYILLGQWLASMLGASFSVVGVMTIIFAVLQRKSVPVESIDMALDELPPVPKKDEVIAKSESVFGIVMAVFFAILFLAVPQFIMVAVTDDQGVISIFNTEVLRSAWVPIVAFVVLGIVKHCVRLVDGRYTSRVAISTVVVDVLSGVLAAVFLTQNGLVSSSFVEYMHGLFGAEGAVITQAFAHSHLILLGIILFALLLDIVTVLYKTVKYAGRPATEAPMENSVS